MKEPPGFLRRKVSFGFQFGGLNPESKSPALKQVQARAKLLISGCPGDKEGLPQSLQVHTTVAKFSSVSLTSQSFHQLLVGAQGGGQFLPREPGRMF